MHTSRRTFLGASALGALSALRGPSVSAAPKKYKVAVIGRTGGGNYGHSYEMIFRGLDAVSLEAIADGDPKGLAAAAKRSGAKRQYADYRDMLDKERPDLVSIAPRLPDCHRAMAEHAIATGAHIFMEKPFTATIEDADAIVEAAEKQGTRIALAHHRRYQTVFHNMKGLLEQGFAGQVLEARFRGKQDARVGGEDMIVLGTHDFDTMRMFFGDPIWCSAMVTTEGRPIVMPGDARNGSEPIRVAGDTIRATFGFPNGVICTWDSIRTDDHWNRTVSSEAKWGFEIRGTRRILVFQSGKDMMYWDSPFSCFENASQQWRPLPVADGAVSPDWMRQPIRSLIHAIEAAEEPVCSARDGRWTVEMLTAVYQSALTGRRIPFPLQVRVDPLKG